MLAVSMLGRCLKFGSVRSYKAGTAEVHLYCWFSQLTVLSFRVVGVVGQGGALPTPVCPLSVNLIVKIGCDSNFPLVTLLISSGFEDLLHVEPPAIYKGMRTLTTRLFRRCDSLLVELHCSCWICCWISGLP